MKAPELEATAVQRIAASQRCSVYRCAGGCLHVQIGPTTLVVSPALLEELSDVVSEARLYLLGGDRRAH